MRTAQPAFRIACMAAVALLALPVLHGVGAGQVRSHVEVPDLLPSRPGAPDREPARATAHGTPALAPAPYVVGGAPVPVAQAPAAMVRLVEPGTSDGFCGGSLISPFAVLTAAHCVSWPDGNGDGVEDDPFPFPPSSLQVLAGSRVRGGLGGARVAVTSVNLHPDWDPTTLDGDMAVLMLAKPQKGPYASVIGADQAGLLAPGATTRAFGWGFAVPGVVAPMRLFAVDLPLVGPAACQDAMDGFTAANSLDPVTVSGNMLCAGQAGKSTCQGDSGGPLFLVGPGGALTQAGVVSWGFDCLGDPPAVFANVQAMRSFLDPFLAATAGFQLDVKTPWVDTALFWVDPSAETDPCPLRFSTMQLGNGPSCPPAAGLVGRSLFVYLPPSATKTRFEFEAVDGSFSVMSNGVALSAQGKSATMSKVPVEVKPLPDVAVIRVKPDPTFAFVTIGDGATFCQLEMWGPTAPADCTGDTLIPLGWPFVAAIGESPEALPDLLGFTGGGYAGLVAPVEVTDLFELPVRLTPGGVVEAAPKLALSTDFVGLDLKGAKAPEWAATIWPAGMGSPLDLCLMSTLPAYDAADCLGPLAGLPGAIGLQGGKVVFWADMNADGVVDADDLPWTTFDVEAVQVLPKGTSVAVAENVVGVPGKIVPVPLRFGAPVPAP